MRTGLAAHNRTRTFAPRTLSALAAAAALCLLPACGRPAGVVFDPANRATRWPPPPDTPRIAYVGSIGSDQDLKPRRAGGRALGEALFGKESARSMLSPLGVCTDGAQRVF